MNDPIKVYAVVSGRYSDYKVHAIYRRLEDAEARCEASNSAPHWTVDGKPASDDEVMALDWNDERVHIEPNPAREDVDDMRVEEFDYYEGEPIPASLEG